MQGQGNWYAGEIWINERSAELERTATRDTRSSRRPRDGARAYKDRQHERSLARLLASVEQRPVAQRATNLRQRLGSWVVRLVG